MSSETEDKSFAVRELLPGQEEGQLVAVHCENPDCGKNPKSGINFGGSRLLGRYYPGTRGEVKCPRCGHVNKFKVAGGRFTAVKPG
jgi:hypothetical protein